MKLRTEAEFRKRRRKLLTDSLLDLKKEGVKYSDIAKEFGVDPSRITRIIKGEDLYLSTKLVEKYLNILGTK